MSEFKLPLQLTSGALLHCILEYYNFWIALDTYDHLEKVYQIIGYAHYHNYEVICNF